MADADTATDEYFSELLGFLQDPKAEVRRFAAEGVLQSTENQDFLGFCQRQPRAAARPLLRLAESAGEAAVAAAQALAAAGSSEDAERKAATQEAEANATASSALQALVNLSAVPAVREELVGLSAPRRCAESLRGGWLEGRADNAHWHAMLLANLTTAKAGQEALCADEALVRFLFAAYTAKPRPPPRDGYDDPLFCLGKVLGNIFVLSEGRRALAGADAGSAAVATLVAELADRSRRRDALAAVRNLCIDPSCHLAVVGTELLPRMALFLYPWEKATPDQRQQLPEGMQGLLAEKGAAMTGEASVRELAAGCMVGLCKTGEGREYLRANGGVQLLSTWGAEEREEAIRTAIQVATMIEKPEDDLLDDQKLVDKDKVDVAELGGFVTDMSLEGGKPGGDPAPVEGQ